ncbi:MAG: carboxylate--amine ligase [Ruminococcaceae bacterium]|nr:carboxylate--amine ligase [Oscillospiraceae bacterium]
MAKLMVLGGSNCQRNALIAARRLGHQTVLIDYYDHPPAAELADIHVKASTFDLPACLAAAKEHHVDGIFTIGTDQPVYTAACVAAELGLPSPISTKTALAVTNKKVMKRILAEHEISAAEYHLIGLESGPGALDGLHSPFVLKPVDSQGQRGIFKLNCAEEVVSHLGETLSFSRQKEALVEEFYPSAELTVSGWVQDGKLFLLAVTDRQCFDDPVHIGVCVGHRFPTVHMARYQEIARISCRIVDAFAIRGGPIYIQMLVGKDGIKVNELACRIGGAFEDVFLPYLSGFDLLHAVIDSALGNPVDCSLLEEYDPSQNPRQVSVQLMFCNSGKVCTVTPLEELRALPYVLDAGYNYGLGDRIPALENATARFGHCVIVSETGGMEEKLREFYRLFRVLDDNGRNLVIPRNFAGEIPAHL